MSACNGNCSGCMQAKLSIAFPPFCTRAHMFDHPILALRPFKGPIELPSSLSRPFPSCDTSSHRSGTCGSKASAEPLQII